MLLTLGVKNLFGCVVGLTKPEWHLRSGVDRNMFARLLVQIYQAVQPAATLVDGILALEGQGPGRRGNPRHVGVLVGSRSGLAADVAICRMLGIAPHQLPTLHAAEKLSVLEGEPKIIGDFSKISNYKLPKLGSLTFGPKPIQKFMRKHFIQRPAVEAEVCKMCGECWHICPAGAITPYEEIIGFDYDRCIRCYCCVEVCPHGALQAVETIPGKLLRRITHLNE
jgi:ferredoxin